MIKSSNQRGMRGVDTPTHVISPVGEPLSSTPEPLFLAQRRPAPRLSPPPLSLAKPYAPPLPTRTRRSRATTARPARRRPRARPTPTARPARSGRCPARPARSPPPSPTTSPTASPARDTTAPTASPPSPFHPAGWRCKLNSAAAAGQAGVQCPAGSYCPIQATKPLVSTHPPHFRLD
jgi:hypothetical protein